MIYMVDVAKFKCWIKLYEKKSKNKIYEKKSKNKIYNSKH